MWLIVIAVCLGAGLYAFILYCKAKSLIDEAPRDDMFLCQKHGAFPKKATLQIDIGGMEYQTDTGELSTEKVAYCPRCYEDRIKEAEARYKK